MFIKGLGFELSFGKKEVAMKDDAINMEKPDEDLATAADALLTPMGEGGAGSRMEPVEIPLPLVVDDGDEEVAQAADALLTPVVGDKDNGPARRGDGPSVQKSSTAGEDTPDVKDTSAQSTQSENPTPGDEPSGKAPESGDEAVAVEPESEGKNLFSDSLFEQQGDEEETPIQGLIASLPDITVQEVLNAAEEVKALMHKWQSSGPTKVPEDVELEK